FRGALVACSIIISALATVYSIALLITNPLHELESLNTATANSVVFHPAVWATALVLGMAGAWWERRLENTPEFALGLLIGELSVLGTVFLNCLALFYGGESDWHTLALLTFVVHLPIAVIEGIVLGFMVGFLARVKPEMLSWSLPEKGECAAETH